MNLLAPSYVAPNVLIAALAVVAASAFGLHKALNSAAWPAQDRRRATLAGALMLATWLLAAALPGWFGFYRQASARVPSIAYALLIPIAAAVALYRLSTSFRRVIDALPQQWIVALQLYRAEGVIFLVLYAGGRLPGVFAWPAGVGDVLVGLLAPIVAIAYTRDSRSAAGWLLAWNLFGIADLALALTTGFLSSPSPFQRFAFAEPNQLITAFPLVVIPAFLVPLSILLHLASLQKLRAKAAAYPLTPQPSHTAEANR